MNKKKVTALITASLIAANLTTNIAMATTTAIVEPNAVSDSTTGSTNEAGTTTAETVAVTEKAIPRTEMSVTTNSENNDSTEAAKNILDGNPSTIWHSQYQGLDVSEDTPATLTITFKGEKTINRVQLLPRPEANANGIIKDYAIVDGNGKEIIRGQLDVANTMKNIVFPSPVTTNSLTIKVFSSYGKTADVYGTLAEFYAFESVTNVSANKIASVENKDIKSGSYPDLSEKVDTVKSYEEGTAIIRFQTTTKYLQTLFSISNNAENAEHFQLYIDNRDGYRTIGYELRTKAKDHLSSKKNTNITLNSGINTVAFKAEKSGGYSIYLNGQLVLLEPDTTPMFLSALSTATTFHLGKTERTNNNSVQEIYNFVGKVDFFEFYDKPLSHEYLTEITGETAAPAQDKDPGAPAISSVEIMDDNVSKYAPDAQFNLKVKFNQVVSVLGERDITLNIDNKDIPCTLTKINSTEYKITGTLPADMKTGEYDVKINTRTPGLTVLNYNNQTMNLTNDIILNDFKLPVEVDKTALKAELALSEPLASQEADYTKASWANFNTKLAAARTANDSSVTKAQVETATNELTQARTELVSLVELRTYIADCNSVDRGTYTETTWNNFKAAITTAEGVLGRADASAIDLATAKTTLEGVRALLVNEEGATSADTVAITERAIPRTGMTVATNSENTATNEFARNVLDGDPNTIWHSNYNSDLSPENPATITINFQEEKTISRIQVLPRKEVNGNGVIKEYRVKDSSGNIIDQGQWDDSNTPKSINFSTPVKTSSITIEVISSYGSPADKYATMADFYVFERVEDKSATKTISEGNYNDVKTGNHPDLKDQLSKVDLKEEGTAIIRFQSSNSGLQSLFSISNNTKANEHFHVYIYGGKVGYELRRQTGGDVSKNSVDAVLNPGINTLAFKAEKDGGYSIYLNGKHVLFTPPTTPMFLDAIKGATSFNLGKTERSSDINSANYTVYPFTGQIDSFEFYDGALDHYELMKITGETATGETAAEVDKTDLKAEIAESEKITEEANYTKNSWASFSSALTEAKAVEASDDKNQTEVDTAKNTLTQARTNLVSLVELKTYITECEGISPDTYTNSSWTRFKEAITTAKGILGKEDATKENVIKAKNDLKAVRDSLVKLGDKTALQAAIDSYTSKEDDKNLYTPESWATAKEKYDAAVEVKNSNDVDETAVNNATKALEDAIKALEKAITDLEKVTANLNLTGKKDIELNEIVDFKLAVADIKETDDIYAIEVNLTYDADKFQLEDQGITAVDTAKTRVQYKEIEPGKVKIVIASLANPIVSGSEIVNIKLKAKAVADSSTIAIAGTSSNGEGNFVEVADGNISVSIKEKVVIDKTALNAAVTNAEKLTASEYTEATWKTLTDALTAAKEVQANENATQEDVNKAENALKAAIEALENIVVDEPKEPVDEPKEPGDEPKEPVDKPKEPGDEPKEPVDEPKEPVDEPKEPGDEPKEPGDEPKEPGDELKEPVDEPKEPVDEPKELGDEQKELGDETTIHRTESGKNNQKVNQENKNNLPNTGGVSSISVGALGTLLALAGGFLARKKKNK